MAKIINSDKGFKLIECSMSETLKFGGMGICDYCGSASFSGVVISVLNSWYCTRCFEEWHTRSIRHKEDEPYENHVFKHFTNILNPTQESEVSNG